MDILFIVWTEMSGCRSWIPCSCGQGGDNNEKGGQESGDKNDQNKGVLVTLYKMA